MFAAASAPPSRAATAAAVPTPFHPSASLASHRLTASTRLLRGGGCARLREALEAFRAGGESLACVVNLGEGESADDMAEVVTRAVRPGE